MLVFCGLLAAATLAYFEMREDAHLVPVPFPALAESEPAVREHLERARAEFEARFTGAPLDPSLGRAFGELGINYHRYALHDAALACYRNAELLDLASYEWPYGAGLIWGQQGEMDPAISALERCLERKPDCVAAMVSIAELELQVEPGRRDLSRAERRCRRALEIDPRAARAIFVWGLVATELGDFEQAKRLFEEAKRLAPAATEINYPLGIAHRELGDRARAQECMAQRGAVGVAAADPFLARVQSDFVGSRLWSQRGASLAADGNMEAAADMFGRAARQAKGVERAQALANAASANTNRAGDLLAQGSREEAAALIREARAELEAALEEDPGNAHAHLNLAAILAGHCGDDAGALRHLGEAIRLAPEDSSAHLQLAVVLARHGRNAEALAPARAAARLVPGNREARLRVVWILTALERYDEALAAAEEGARDFPQDEQLQALAARLLATGAGNATSADRALVIAERLRSARLAAGKPPSGELVEITACALARLGRFDEAEVLLAALRASMEKRGRVDLLGEVDRLLAAVRSGAAVGRPYAPGHPNLRPPAPPKLLDD